MIFDDIEREYDGVATHREDEYYFLNRSARPAAAKVRALLEEWSTAYPETERSLIKTRLKSEFHSVFFELFVHAMLRHLGCTVDAHPELNLPKQTKPDFLATFPSGEKVIIECCYPTDRRGPSKADQARLNALIDEINQVYSPDLCLHLNEVSGLDVRQPSTRRLRAFIQEQINRLDADELLQTAQQSGYGAMPSWDYRDREFSLKFSIWPKSPETRGSGSNPIWAFPTETRWGGSSGILKAVITEKVAKYSEMSVPFLVAVNEGRLPFLRRQDELSALFGGAEQLTAGEYAIPSTGIGAWLGRGGPQNTRLSAVLFAQVFPWNLPSAPHCLYHNPFAKRPCRNLPWQVTQAVPRQGKLVWEEGTTIGSLFGLPSNWPGKLFD
jgi:hypothetical protein